MITQFGLRTIKSFRYVEPNVMIPVEAEAYILSGIPTDTTCREMIRNIGHIDVFLAFHTAMSSYFMEFVSKNNLGKILIDDIKLALDMGNIIETYEISSNIIQVLKTKRTCDDILMGILNIFKKHHTPVFNLLCGLTNIAILTYHKKYWHDNFNDFWKYIYPIKYSELLSRQICYKTIN